MKNRKRYLLLRLMFTLAVLAACCNAYARENERSDSARLEEVVVRAESEIETSVNIVKIGREDIEREGADNAAQALEGQAAIHATSGGKGERIFKLRGFSQRQIAVLIDGLPSTIPYEGQADLSMMPAELIESITIIKGPGSVLYGPNGLGGAINIITRPAGDGPFFSMKHEVSGFDSIDSRLVHSMQNGIVGHSVAAGLSFSDGFPLSSSFDEAGNENGGLRENSDRRSTYGLANLGIDLGDGHHLRMGGFYIDGEKGVPPAIDIYDPRYWRFTDWNNASATLGHGWKSKNGLVIDEVLYFRHYYNLLDSYDDATYSTQNTGRAFHSWLLDRSIGGRIRLRHWFRDTAIGDAAIRLWLSAQYDRHEKKSDFDLPSYIYERSLISLAPETEIKPIDELSLLAAVQLDLEIPGDLPDFSPGEKFGWGPLLKISYKPLPELALSLSGARRVRFPTLKERFSGTLEGNIPNPSLATEIAWHSSFEITYEPFSWLALAASAFDAEVEDLIEIVHLGGGDEQIRNVGRARLAGAEMELSVDPYPWLRFQASYMYLYGRLLHESSPEDRLEYTPGHKANLSFASKPLDWLELGTMLRIVGEQSFEHPESGKWGKLGMYALWDARADHYPVEWLGIWMRVSNLLDMNYQTKFGYPDPGRRIWIGLKLLIADAS